MADDDKKLTREERLAAKLRENLRRRKAQGRAIGADGTSESESPERELPKPEQGS